MRIESFQFRDRATGWELEETKLDAFNLLVGVSGVGKTKILQALEQIRKIALGSDGPSAEWSIRFEHGGTHYRWQASTMDADQPRKDGDGDGSASPHIFHSEQITSNAAGVVVSRLDSSFAFQSASLPKLKRTESAITLLAEEALVAPIHSALKSIVSSESTGGKQGEMAYVRGGAIPVDRRWTITAIRESFDLPTTLQAYLVQEHAPQDWQAIKDMFVEVFPSVDNLRVDRVDRSDGLENFDLSLREKSAASWIPSAAMSSGMRRTLVHFIDIYLAPPGSVILIDDLENSLGNNCMPALVDFILSRAPDLQFIITSHHPYVINNLPISTWKLVQRRGSHVRVLPAPNIPALQKASHHEAFLRLLNLPEFEDGIA